MQSSKRIPKDLKPMLLFNMLYNEALSLAAQPIINLVTGQVEAVEILSRSPGGVLLPEEMFQLARQHGVLEQLTLLSCKKMLENIEILKPFISKGIFFNIEADVSEGILEEMIREIRRSEEISLVLEITEHMPTGVCWRKLAEGKGFYVAMDDLGRGHSNMVELLKMHPHYVKICMEIVSDVHLSGAKSLLVQAYRQIGDTLNIQVIAEGIENFDELAKLREMGIEYGQGYYFARPCLLQDIPVQEWKAGFSSRI